MACSDLGDEGAAWNKMDKGPIEWGHLLEKFK